MKSYIEHVEGSNGVHYYECGLCGQTWTSKSAGKPWDKPDKLADDGTPPVYEEREFPRGQGVVKAIVEAKEAEGDYGKNECPFCGGSRPIK